MDVSRLPAWLLLAVVVGVAVSIAVGAILLANRTMPEAGREQNSTLSPFISVVGLIYGALLGFTVVMAWQQFSSAQVIVADEASTLTTMYRQTVAMSEPEQTQLRQLLRQYASAVASSEWDRQSSGGASDGAGGAITGMYRVVGTQPPGLASGPINQAFLNQVTVLASDRTTRIIDAKPRIPGLLWVVLVFGGTALVALTGFLRMGTTLGHIIVSGTIAILLGLLLCIPFRLDHPFGTDRGITPETFQRSFEVFDAVDRGI
jgi:hypothetical protein